MAVRFICGRAGSGKTRHCLAAVADALARSIDTARLFLIVPEQASFQMERALALACPGGAYWRAEVLSFSRLAQRVFDETGVPPPVLRPRARRLALRAVAAAAPQARLAFGSASGSRGFFNELDRLIEELLAEGITPAALRIAAERLGDSPQGRRATAAATLYADYLRWLGPDRLDPAQRYVEVRRRLEQAEFLRGSRVWIDGFAGFTGEELMTVVHLGSVADSIDITMLIDPHSLDRSGPPPIATPSSKEEATDPLDLFERTRRTIGTLSRALNEAGVAVVRPHLLAIGPASRLSSVTALAAVEQELADSEAGPVAGPESSTQTATTDEPPPPSPTRPSSDPPSGLHIIECASHRDELRAAARMIRGSVRAAGATLHYRDFALIARDLEPHWHLVQEVLGEYEIPFFLDRRRSNADHALFRSVAALLNLVGGFSVKALSELLVAGLMDAPRVACEQLHAMIGRAGPSAAHAWENPAADHRWLRGRNDKGLPDPAPRLFVRGRVRTAVQALRESPAATDGSVTRRGRDWLLALRQALDHLGIRKSLSQWIDDARAEGDWEAAQTHANAWESLLDLLDDFAAVFGEQRISALDFVDALTHGLSESTGAIAPPTLDQVLVASIDRSRHPDVRHAWLFGFNDGLFPRPAGEDALLRAGEREALRAAGLAALPVANDGPTDERLLAYVAMTRASHSLHISHAKIGSDGQPLRPSSLLDAVRPHATTERSDAPRGAPPASLAEFARGYLAEHRERGGSVSRGMARLRSSLEGSARIAARVRALLSGLTFDNRPDRLPLVALNASPRRTGVSALRRGVGAIAASASNEVRLTGSSELESFIDCPFKHYANHRLRLDQPARTEPPQRTHGSVAHAALALVTRDVIAARLDVRELTDPQWIERLRDAWPRAVESVIASPVVPREIDLMRRLESLVAEALLAQADRWRRGHWRPVAAELSFGDEANAIGIPALRLIEPAADHPGISLRGRIDRVDGLSHAGFCDLLVFDYKSDARSLHASQLTGQALQIYTYLLALLRAPRRPVPPDCGPDDARAERVAGAFIVPIYSTAGKARSVSFHSAHTDSSVQRMLLLRPRGVIRSSVAHTLDESLREGATPVANLSIKKQGGFSAVSDARPAEHIDAMLDLADRTLRQEGLRLAEGTIEIAPLLRNRTLACTRCEFRAVCRFDRTVHAPRVAEFALPRLSVPFQTNPADLIGADPTTTEAGE